MVEVYFLRPSHISQMQQQRALSSYSSSIYINYPVSTSINKPDMIASQLFTLSDFPSNNTRSYLLAASIEYERLIHLIPDIQSMMEMIIPLLWPPSVLLLL